MVIPINKRKVDAINNMVNPAPVVEPINPVSNWPVTEIKPTDTFTQNQNRQKELEWIIKSGWGNASVNAEYNRLTGNQQWARDVMLWSTEAQKTMKTTITPEEAGFIAQSWVKDIWEWVKPDMTAGTKEDFKQAMDTTKVTTETTPTWTIKTTETPAWATKIESIDQFKQAGWWLSNLEQLVENRYWTVATQEADGSLTATIWDEKFKWTIDESGNPKKVSLGKVWWELMQDADNVFNIMKSGWIVDKNSSNYQAVKDRFDKFKQYSWYWVEQLATLLSDGILLSWTTSYNDLYNDPVTRVKLENAQKLNVINKKSTDINKIQESQSESILENKTNTINAFDDWVLTPEEYSAMLNSPEISAKSTEVEWKVNKYNWLKAQYDAIEDDVRAELEWTWATESYISAKVSERQKNMYKQIVIAQWEMNTAIWTLSELKNLQATIVETNLSLYNQQQAKLAQQEQLKAQQQFQTASDLRNFEQQKEILKLQQDYQDANIQTDLIQVGNKNVLINRKTGETIKSFELPTQITKPEWPIKMGEDSLYDPVTQQWITKPSATSWFTITQNYWATSPNSKDNVKLANWQVWTPWVDYSMSLNTPINTWITWEVTFVWNKWDYWNQVIITDEQWNQHMYSHLNSANVKLWDKVTSGQNIALSWNTWFSTWPHLDYRVKSSNWQWLDPNNFSWVWQAQPTWINKNALWLYRSYMEDGKLPSKDALKWLWMTSEQFIDSANEWYNQYIQDKAKEISSTYPTLNIEFTPSYANISATQREKLNDSLTKIWDIDQRLQKLKDLFWEVWTEVWPTKKKSEMETLRKQIILKAKEVENLWVLNWPDLWILEDLLPSTTWFVSWMFSWDENTKSKLDSIQSWYRSDAKTKWINYWAKISFKDEWQKVDTTWTSIQYWWKVYNFNPQE